MKDCENRVEYEFRDAPEEGGITRWCEKHVQVYMTQRRGRLDDEAHTKAMELYNRQLESDAKIAYAKMKQEHYEADLKKKTSQFSMAFSPGDLWHMVTCGCQPGSQRELTVDDGMGTAYCHNCNFFLGKARIKQADLETTPGYDYNILTGGNPVGKLGVNNWLRLQIDIDLQGTRQLRGIAPNVWARAPMEHKIIQEEHGRNQQHRIDEMFGVSKRADAVGYHRNAVQPSGKFDDQMLSFLRENLGRKKARE